MPLRPTLVNRYPLQHFLRAARSIVDGLEAMAASAPDLAYLRNVGQHVFLAKHPDLVREVLTVQAKALVKGRSLQRTRHVLGNGLLTSEGEFHLRQRRLAQPAFHRERIARYAQDMVRITDRTAVGWRDGQRMDAAQAMHVLTLDIVAKTLFDADVGARAAAIGGALHDILRAFTLVFIAVGDRMLDWPLPRMRRARRAVQTLDREIYAIIAERRASGEDRGDLLSMLLAARDDEGDGSGMTDQQLRDEVMTLFLAGHETTANALAWSWWFLAQHPDVEARLHAEVDALGGRLPTMADLPALSYTRAVFAETLRLRPPAYAFTREVAGELVLDGHRIPRGAQVALSPWVTQRDPRWWDDPLRFDPDRWARGEPRHKGAFFPFGGGTRLCIGEQFAWTEGTLLLATLARRWRLALTVPADRVGIDASVTLRPKGGVPVQLHARRGGGASTAHDATLRSRNP